MGRIRSLDILRAVAIGLVLGRHLPPWPDDAPVLLSHGLALWHRCGWIGVDLFFVLSGFLVSGLLFREFSRYGDVHIGRFLVRRGFKIYPAFYVMLAVTVVFNWWAHSDVTTANYISECLFLQSYFPGAWQHTWTLAVEEHFYLFVALLVGFLALRSKAARDPFTSLPMVFYCVASCVLLMRCVRGLQFDFDESIHLYPSHLRIDSLLFGVFLSYLSHYHANHLVGFTNKFRFQLLSFALLLISPAAFMPLGSTPWLPAFGLTLLYLGFGAIVVGTVDWAPSCPPVVRAVGSGLGAVGIYSYSIYLWHMFVSAYSPGVIKLLTGLQLEGWNRVIVYLLGSVVVGVCMAKLVELPTLRVRDRYFPSRSRTENSPRMSTAMVARGAETL